MFAGHSPPAKDALSSANNNKIFSIFKQQQRFAKRTKPDSDNDDDVDPSMSDDRFAQLLNAIEANNSAIKNSHAAQLAKIDEFCENVTAQVNVVREDVAKVSATVGKHDIAINILRQQMNEIEQTKLDCHMEIAGIAKAEIDKHRQDVVTFASQIIGHYANNLDKSSIRSAFIRDTRAANISIIVVVFVSVEQKNLVMKLKRETKDDVRIFFDDRATSITRAIFMKARQVAKDIGAKKASLNHGKVFITKQDDSRVKIRWFDDLDRLQQQSQAHVAVQFPSSNPGQTTSSSIIA